MCARALINEMQRALIRMRLGYINKKTLLDRTCVRGVLQLALECTEGDDK
jgi:hypothetical protein